MPAPKNTRVVDPPTYVYVRVTRFGIELAKDVEDAKRWANVGVPVWRYRVEGRAGQS